MLSSEAHALVNQLNNQKFKLGQLLLKQQKLTLRQFLKSLIPPPNTQNNRYFSYLQAAMAVYLNNFTKKHIDDECAILEKTPVIQQADHANLLLDAETFLNNFLFALACRENNIDKMITSQCTTVSCLSRRNPVQGPTFLHTAKSVYSILDFSKRTLKNSNFCCLPTPTKVHIRLLEGKYPVSKNTLLSKINGLRFINASACYHYCNEILWESLKIPGQVKRIAVDESMVSYLAQLHLRDKYSPIYQIFFETKIRDSFISIKRQFIRSAQNRVINKLVPDFLWYKHGTKLYPLRLVGTGKQAHYNIEYLNKPLPFSPTVESLSEALCKGVLYVDKFIAYLIRCLLPGIRAVGGTSQQDYVDHYQTIIGLTQQTTPFLSTHDFNVLMNKDLTQLGGNPLLEMSLAQKSIIANLNENTDLTQFANQFIDLPVSETIGTLNCAQYLIEPFQREVLKHEYIRDK